ncbi:hypothetical protein PO124_31605 [Bacillus licheniformis]|nr:hypothetical protein [Bacillus licheniformis]
MVNLAKGLWNAVKTTWNTFKTVTTTILMQSNRPDNRLECGEVSRHKCGKNIWSSVRNNFNNMKNVVTTVMKNVKPRSKPLE